MSKLLLNSLYGKFGMKEQDSKLKIMSVESAKQIKKNKKKNKKKTKKIIIILYLLF